MTLSFLGSPQNADEVLVLPSNKDLTGVLTIQLMVKKLRKWGDEVEAHRVPPTTPPIKCWMAQKK